MTRRVIAHFDCDAFYATVELLRRPELRGKPVIVSGSGPRAVVTTASYEARKYGVGSAMATSRALRLCPDAVLIPPDFEAYKKASSAVWALVSARFDVMQSMGMDEAYADLTHVERPISAVREVIATVKDQTGIQLSAGIAPSRLIAKIASDLDKPAGLVVLSREQACEVLADRSLRIIPGVGPKSAERLAQHGLRTLADLQARGPDELIALFGARQGGWLHERAYLRDDSPLVTSRVAKSRSCETTFDEDVTDLGELELVVRRQATRLANALESRGINARTVGIKVRLDDWTNVTRARTPPEPVADEDAIAEHAIELLRAYAPPRPVRLIGVRIAGFSGSEQPSETTQERAIDQMALPIARPGVGVMG